MPYVITSPCIDVMDQSCVEVCPVDCIHFEQGLDRMLAINPDECIDCGACEPVCPVTAIYPLDAVPEDQQEFIELNARWYTDPDYVRARVNEIKPPE
jgi:ferredoxin